MIFFSLAASFSLSSSVFRSLFFSACKLSLSHHLRCINAQTLHAHMLVLMWREFDPRFLQNIKYRSQLYSHHPVLCLYLGANEWWHDKGREHSARLKKAMKTKLWNNRIQCTSWRGIHKSRIQQSTLELKESIYLRSLEYPQACNIMYTVQ